MSSRKVCEVTTSASTAKTQHAGVREKKLQEMLSFKQKFKSSPP